MSDSVRHIHTQADAQAEIERQRRLWREQYARRRQRSQDNSDYQTRLHSSWTERKRNSRKRIAMDEDLSDVVTRKHAVRMATIRQAQKEKNLEQAAEERAETFTKIGQRYDCYPISLLMQFRLKELDADFYDLQIQEQQWPTPLPDVKPMYKKCVTQIHHLAKNIVCACCGCIYHDVSQFNSVSPYSFLPFRHLQIPSDVDIPFDFSCGIDILDQNRVVIDRLGITDDKQLRLCRSCYNQLSRDRMPTEALANFRWFGDVPEELQGLNWACSVHSTGHHSFN
jgi:hypothetical protein